MNCGMRLLLGLLLPVLWTSHGEAQWIIDTLALSGVDDYLPRAGAIASDGTAAFVGVHPITDASIVVVAEPGRSPRYLITPGGTHDVAINDDRVVWAHDGSANQISFVERDGLYVVEPTGFSCATAAVPCSASRPQSIELDEDGLLAILTGDGQVRIGELADAGSVTDLTLLDVPFHPTRLKLGSGGQMLIYGSVPFVHPPDLGPSKGLFQLTPRGVSTNDDYELAYVATVWSHDWWGATCHGMGFDESGAPLYLLTATGGYPQMSGWIWVESEAGIHTQSLTGFDAETIPYGLPGSNLFEVRGGSMALNDVGVAAVEGTFPDGFRGLALVDTSQPRPWTPTTPRFPVPRTLGRVQVRSLEVWDINDAGQLLARVRVVQDGVETQRVWRMTQDPSAPQSVPIDIPFFEDSFPIDMIDLKNFDIGCTYCDPIELDVKLPAPSLPDGPQTEFEKFAPKDLRRP